ncbi:MAG: hypothetical protein RBR02_06250 [Desulfuromonadaceae bacterium]|nr:hypothetical protein [Desulfuromonadaceae bacterium]
MSDYHLYYIGKGGNKLTKEIYAKLKDAKKYGKLAIENNNDIDLIEIENDKGELLYAFNRIYKN